MASAIRIPADAAGAWDRQSPALVDTNENGLPDPGVDLEITIESGPSGIVINSPWHCNQADVENVVNFVAADAKRGGKIVSAERTIRSKIVQRVVIAPDSFLEGRPRRVNFEELQPGQPAITGWLELQDRNGDGLHERGVVAREIPGGAIKVELNFIGADANGDGRPDYLSIPWGRNPIWLGSRSVTAVDPPGQFPRIHRFGCRSWTPTMTGLPIPSSPTWTGISKRMVHFSGPRDWPWWLRRACRISRVTVTGPTCARVLRWVSAPSSSGLPSAGG